MVGLAGLNFIGYGYIWEGYDGYGWYSLWEGYGVGIVGAGLRKLRILMDLESSE